MRTPEEVLKETPLIDLARMAHKFENEDNDIDFMKVMDEVNSRGKVSEFRKLYMKVWGDSNHQNNQKNQLLPCHEQPNSPANTKGN